MAPPLSSRVSPLLSPLTTLGAHPDAPRLLAALRRLYTLATLALLVPGVLLGLLLLLVNPFVWTAGVLLLLLAVGALCALPSLVLARRQAARPAPPGQHPGGPALGAAAQLAAAPAVPLLLACVAFSWLPALLSFAALGLAVFLLGWALLPGFAQRGAADAAA